MSSASSDPKSFGRAFAVEIATKLGNVFVEGSYGVVRRLMVLMADAGR